MCTYIHTYILTVARISPVPATTGAMGPGETVRTGIVFYIGTEGRLRGWKLLGPLKLSLKTPRVPKLGERDLRGVPFLPLSMTYIC